MVNKTLVWKSIWILPHIIAMFYSYPAYIFSSFCFSKWPACDQTVQFYIVRLPLRLHSTSLTFRARGMPPWPSQFTNMCLLIHLSIFFHQAASLMSSKTMVSSGATFKWQFLQNGKYQFSESKSRRQSKIVLLRDLPMMQRCCLQ